MNVIGRVTIKEEVFGKTPLEHAKRCEGRWLMGKLFFIFFLMLSSSAFAGIGDSYNCKVIDGVFRDYNKEMSLIGDNYKNDPVFDQKFVWLEGSITIKLRDDFSVHIEHQSNEESFEAYDGFHKLSFKDGFLIWSRQGHNPIGYSMNTYQCKNL